MPLNLNYWPKIEEKTGKTIKDFLAWAKKNGLDDPAIKPAAIIARVKADFDLGHGHAMFIAHTIKIEVLKSVKKTPSVSRKAKNQLAG